MLLRPELIGRTLPPLDKSHHEVPRLCRNGGGPKIAARPQRSTLLGQLAALCRLAEGDSPHQARYATANLPNSQKPKRVAISVTVVVDGSAAHRAPTRQVHATQ